ncbi:MAG: PdaC/SigV domain-containing protein [Rickettsiales bacterium]
MMRALIVGVIALMPALALAEKPHVSMLHLQKGIFEDPECETDDDFPDACLSDCDISYPVVDGIEHMANQKALNKKWEQKGEQQRCAGRKIAEGLTADRTPNVYKSDYDVLVNDGVLLSFSENVYTYGAGAAHGIGGSDGVIIDARMGKELGTGDLLDMSKANELNEYLLDQIEKDERVFDTIRETRAKEYSPFISDKNREFTLMLKEDGLYAQFGVYQIGPYSSGEIDYLIPREFISNQHILKRMDEKEQRDAQR